MKNRRDDDGCCSRMFLKSIMVVFNTFFGLSGVVFLLIGVGSMLLRHSYVSLMDSPLFPITTYVFVGIGGLILLTGFLGCIGTLQEIRCCLILYALILMLVFLLEACIGVVAYLYESAIHEELSRTFNRTVTEKYYFDQSVTDAVDEMQRSFECCGPTHFSQWNSSQWAMATNQTNLVPDSCCISPKDGCGTNIHPSNIFTGGCVDELEQFTRLHLILIGGVAVGLSILQLFGICFSCCLSSKLKGKEEV